MSVEKLSNIIKEWLENKLVYKVNELWVDDYSHVYYIGKKRKIFGKKNTYKIYVCLNDLIIYDIATVENEKERLVDMMEIVFKQFNKNQPTDIEELAMKYV